MPPTDTLAGYYQSTPILGNSCVYDPVKNQKVESDFWSVDPATGTWKTTPDRAETYQYDPNLDYLTQANYEDEQPMRFRTGLTMRPGTGLLMIQIQGLGPTMP